MSSTELCTNHAVSLPIETHKYLQVKYSLYFVDIIKLTATQYIFADMSHIYIYFF